MLLQRLSRHIRRHDWFTVGVEILVVIIGLLLAFQIDRWWEQRGERAQEIEYVDRLIDDVEADLPIIDAAIRLAELRKDMADLLMRVAEDPEEAMREPVRFLVAVKQASFTYSPNLTAHTFEDLRSTGNLRLIRDPEIKDALYSYYDFDQDQNQYRPLQFLNESRHFALAAGVLSFDQARFIQDQWYVVQPGEIEQFDASSLDLQKIREAVERLVSRQELIDWLPEMRFLQIEQLLINQDRLRRAENVLNLLRQYAAELK